MARIQDVHQIPNKPAGDVYQAILTAVPRAGLEIWKRRDIAWLVMVRGGSGSQAVDGNVSARPGAQVTVALSSEGLGEAELHDLSQALFRAVTAALG